MNSFLTGYDVALAALKTIFFVLAVVVAVVCAVDWLVRTRRIGPFNPLSRLVRRTVDPLLAPIEHRLVRSGGLPANAPWWALVVVVVGGILVLSLLGFLRQQLVLVTLASRGGMRSLLMLAVQWAIAILEVAIIVRVVASLFRVSPFSPWVRWAYRLSEPLLGPLRRVLPPLGMFDISPIVAYLLLEFVARPLLVGVVSFI